ncbi:Transposase and inactivated derivatives [Actinobacillus ureae]|nr:Transposase and inactivated derivatives [Actinobacillus ureae]SUU44797.1 Transposase and inactivated derivatives [Actinobacillus ureae]
MKITHCKLKKSIQRRLLEFFVAEVTARTAADLLGIQANSWVYTDTYRSYDALDVSEFHHERINHSEIFAERENHINGIENFWSQAKPSECFENIME